MEQKIRPPFVRFETRAIENRQASEERGHYVADDVDFAIVTPVGSKDSVEHRVADWFRNLEEGVKQERIPQEWLSAYKGSYKAWQEGHETPEDGTPVTNWAKASPSQVKIMQAVGVRTVEDMAAANEETVTRIGMGGRALKQAAQAWLDSADHGKVSAELEALRQRDQEREERIKQLEEENKKLAEQVSTLAATAKPGKQKEDA